MESFQKYDDYEHLFFEAINNLDTNRIILGYGDCKYSALELKEGKQLEFSKEELDTEITRLKTEYEALQYQRDRRKEYPSIQELVVALYDTDDKADIEAKRAEVKAKYPKPE